MCEYVPRSQLRQQRDTAVRALELAANSESKLQLGNRSLRLQLQRLLTHSLGPAPAVDCLKYMCVPPPHSLAVL